MGHIINMLIVPRAYRQPHLPLAAHKVQLPSKTAKLYEIQFTLGICLFAKQQSIDMLLAQNSHGQIIPGHLMYCCESTILGRTAKENT